MPFDKRIESLTIAVDGSEAHYLKAGEGPPLVLLHGGSSDSRDWAGVMAEMKTEYTMYAPDIIGYGESASDKQSYYLSDFVVFTRKFMDALGLDAPVLAGHSMGGRIAIEIALLFPGEVSKLVLVDTAGLGVVSKRGTAAATAMWHMRKLLKKPQPYPELLLEEGEVEGWLCTERLAELKKPALLVWKSNDPYFPVSLPMNAKKVMPDASLVVIPGYGHAPHRENVDLFCKYLRNFLVAGL